MQSRRVYRRPAAARPLPIRPRRPAMGGYGAYRKRAPIYRRPVIRKKGAYYVAGGFAAKGSLFGQKAAAGVHAGFSSGKYEGASALSGIGAYNVGNIRHNTLIKPDIPEVRNTFYTEGGTILRHREYLGAITSSSSANSFKIQTYPLNPAQSDTFPWLSTIAQNYEEYRPNGMMFEFRSTASDAIASSTNLALGQVMMCTQ